MRKLLWLLGLLAACSQPTLMDRMRKGDEETAKEAIQQYVSMGETALPELRAALDDPDPLVRRRVKTALGRITGQWGSEGGIVWKRSLEEAVASNPGNKPILVLQLFGKFDEEFC
jgi:hypothetical protein